MNVSLYQAASALHAHSQWQDVIAENLAAGSVPGYKKKEISFSAMSSGVMPANGAGNQTLVQPRANTAINFQPGQLRYTGQPSDLAIEGRGFFEVQLPNGALGYTRDGEFHLTAQGQLVTKAGYAVLSDTGPVQMDPNNHSPITVSSTGEIHQGAESKGSVKVVDFNDLKLLTPISGEYFLAQNPNLQTQEIRAPQVHQGYLEGANTSPLGEMTQLITAMRLFEANQRTIQAQDDRMRRALSELGNLS
jgi:flagellar basal body rod protein FlgG